MNISNQQYNYCLEQIKRFAGNSAEDVLQEILLQMVEYGRKLDKSENYIIGAAYRSYYSKTSPWARKYKQYQDKVDIYAEEVDIPDVLDEPDYMAENILKYIEETPGISWWEKECVKRKVLEEKTFKELSKEYNITENQVTWSFYKAVKAIKKYINQKYVKEN